MAEQSLDEDGKKMEGIFFATFETRRARKFIRWLQYNMSILKDYVSDNSSILSRLKAYLLAETWG